MMASAALLAAGPAQDARPGDPALMARAVDVVDRLASGAVDPVLAQFTDQMKAAVDPASLRSLFPSLVGQIGAFKEQLGARTETRGEFTVVLVSCSFERATVDVQVVFDPQGRIAGLAVRPPAPTTSYEAPSYVTPSAFRSDPVTVDAGGWPLPGTLTVPVGATPVPGVVLVHGSGPHDRDESIGPNKPFRDLAEGLASRGIAVLRYDKRTRTHAARVRQLADFTVKEEVVDDAVAAVELLRETSGIRPDRVFVLGHSQGGMLAPRIGAAAPELAGLIILAGAARSLEDSIVEQTRYLALLDGTISAAEQAQIEEMEKLARAVRALQPSDPPPATPLFSAPTSFWIDLRGYDPPAAAARLDLPMLILQGERDYQVTMADLARWRTTLGSRDTVRIESYSTLNHLFMAGSGPADPAEYAAPGHIAGEVIDDIADWIQTISFP